MPQTFKDKMFEFEAIPPQGVWESIAAELDEENKVPVEPPLIPAQKKTYFKYFSMTAAAAAVIIICFFVFRTSSKNTTTVVASSDTLTNHSGQAFRNKSNSSTVNNRHDAVLHIPIEDDSLKNDKELLADNTSSVETGPSEKTPDENNGNDKSKGSDSKNPVVKVLKEHTYITIMGPQGQPVKISSKAASLLVSTNETPADPKWNKKIIQWKNAMQSNTLAATPGNFMDIVELTNTLTDN